MPAFIENGPHIPEELLDAHEQGKVIFFCGAGISYPSGLPSFKGLVLDTYANLKPVHNKVQQKALDRELYDRAISLLERDLPEGRKKVRRYVVERLTPDLTKEGALTTHESLLILGTTRSGQGRIVTTNFDRNFQEVIKRLGLPMATYAAPLLPMAKKRLDGLVYLHGLIGEQVTDDDLQHLVLSSGDFGLAYLNDGWAARFVTELFRNYRICFVGYSIDDPVMRYFMDALAADQQMGESQARVYAFAPYEPGVEEEDDTRAEWEAKNVTPILYRKADKDHSVLHRTLEGWARYYRDGLKGRTLMLEQHVHTKPLSSSKFDYAVGRVLWALTDDLAASYFSEMNPAPPLDWLEPLDEQQFGHEDLSRFHVSPNAIEDKDLKFSFMRRPTPYTHAPMMLLVNAGRWENGVDNVMRHLALWLTRHLDNPRLLMWLTRWGSHLHGLLTELIRRRLSLIDQLEADGKTQELERMRENSPAGQPNAAMRNLWELFIEGRVKPAAHNSDMYTWGSKFKKQGLTPTLRFELRDLLTPQVVIRDRVAWPEMEETPEPGPMRIKDLVDWDIALMASDVHPAMRDIFTKEEWLNVLHEFLPIATMLLKDAMDLQRSLGGAEDISDLSYMHQPSISDHPQNRDFHDWTALIEIARDSWLSAAKSKTESAAALATALSWFETPYPVFKRLAFFAAAQPNTPVPISTVLGWLNQNDGWWLWSVETQRETMRLIVSLAPRLDEVQRGELEQIIFRGPPRRMFKEDLGERKWEDIVDRDIWHLLAKYRSVAPLSADAQKRLDDLAKKYPGFQLEPNEQDEFPFWMGDGGHWRSAAATPKDRGELAEWLEKNPEIDFWSEDDWGDRCRADFGVAVWVLQHLAEKNVWPVERWRTAVQVWAEPQLLAPAWGAIPETLLKMPAEQLKVLSGSLGYWVMTEAKVFEGNETAFFDLCKRLIEVDDAPPPDSDHMIDKALNTAMGHATQALITWWYRQSLKDGIGLETKLEPIFTSLTDTAKPEYRRARVFLARHVVALFRVDEAWARKNLLPLFDWTKSAEEAAVAWMGFLWSPQLFMPLFSEIKKPFLDTASHYEDLGRDHDGDQYAHLLAFAGLDHGGIFTTLEIAEATSKLPARGLEQTLMALVNALNGSGEQRTEYWNNRVRPYLQQIWPPSKDNKSPAIATRMAQICTSAGDAFPAAVELLHGWLEHVKHNHGLYHTLHESKLCSKYPRAALDLIYETTSSERSWLFGEFMECLVKIETADPELAKDHRFVELKTLYEKNRK